MSEQEELQEQARRNNDALRETGKSMAKDFDARMLNWLLDPEQ